MWGDVMSSFGGVAITYDEIGNPLSYYNGVNYIFSWTGTELTDAVKGSTSYSFTYNDEGIRTSKTKNGVTTTYYLSGSQVVAEETSGNLTVYIYDAEGLPLGMRYHGAAYAEDVWDVYWYEKNIFGDVVAVYNSAGTKLISYKYDAFGKATRSYHNSGGSTTATKNPFRYRGYYYDQDLQLYYLNSRYYDGYTGRFISPDNASCLGAYNSLGGYNLYAYCLNNPLNRFHTSNTTYFDSKQGVTNLENRTVIRTKESSAVCNLEAVVFPLVSNIAVSLAGVSGTALWSITKNGRAFIKYHQIFDGAAPFTTVNNLSHPLNGFFKGISVGIIALDTVGAFRESVNAGHSLEQGALNVLLTAGKNYLSYRTSAYVSATVGLWVGAKLGSSLGSYAGPVGMIIGVVAGAIIGFAIDSMGNVIIDQAVG